MLHKVVEYLNKLILFVIKEVVLFAWSISVSLAVSSSLSLSGFIYLETYEISLYSVKLNM